MALPTSFLKCRLPVKFQTALLYNQQLQATKDSGVGQAICRVRFFIKCKSTNYDEGGPVHFGSCLKIVTYIEALAMAWIYIRPPTTEAKLKNRS